MTNTDDYDWLVQQRSEIQAFLLKLYRRLENENHDAKSLQILHLLLAVGFSLWRAVFLANSDRDLSTANDQAKKFLEVLIEDNAINFRQDSNSRSWTVGYYLNNAYFRLQLAYQMLGKATKLSKYVEEFIKEQKESGIASDAIEPWNNAYKAAEEVFSVLPNHV